jgi:hypothetical protein
MDTQHKGTQYRVFLCRVSLMLSVVTLNVVSQPYEQILNLGKKLATDQHSSLFRVNVGDGDDVETV